MKVTRAMFLSALNTAWDECELSVKTGGCCLTEDAAIECESEIKDTIVLQRLLPKLIGLQAIAMMLGPKGLDGAKTLGEVKIPLDEVKEYMLDTFADGVHVWYRIHQLVEYEKSKDQNTDQVRQTIGGVAQAGGQPASPGKTRWAIDEQLKMKQAQQEEADRRLRESFKDVGR